MIKCGGCYYAPGVELDADENAGRYFVEQGVARSVVLPGEAPVAEVDSDPAEELCQVDGVGKKIAAALVAAGVDSVEGLQEMTVDQLSAVKGVSKARAEQILTDAKQFGGEDNFDEETVLDEDDYLGE
jgi:ERCC4-type nuclease